MARIAGQDANTELRTAYAVGVRSLNHRINRTAPEGDRIPKDPEIDAMLSVDHDGAPDWENLYEAEQRLVLLMGDDDLAADQARRLIEGEHLGVPSTAALAAAYAAATTTDGRRAAHLALVDDLHFRYQKRALDRRVRSEKANTLNWIGIAMVVISVAALIVIYVADWIVQVARYHLLLVLWFGAIGAFLSRIIAFQGALNTLDYDALIRDYSGWSIALRLIVGTIGALVGYFLIWGNLVGGELFPDWTGKGFFVDMSAVKRDLSAAVFTPGDVPTRGDPLNTEPVVRSLSEMKPAEDRVVVFSSDFAKLLVWSTLAGFSERLIPDRLSAVEAAGKEAVRPNR
jgi:hypothetical protein